MSGQFYSPSGLSLKKEPTIPVEGEAGCIQSRFGSWHIRDKCLPLTRREPLLSNDPSSLVADSTRPSACVRFGSARTRWSQRICRGPSLGGCRRFQGPTAPRASCSWEVPSHKHPLFALALSLFTLCTANAEYILLTLMLSGNVTLLRTYSYIRCFHSMLSCFFRVVYNVATTVSISLLDTK